MARPRTVRRLGTLVVMTFYAPRPTEDKSGDQIASTNGEMHCQAEEAQRGSIEEDRDKAVGRRMR